MHFFKIPILVDMVMRLGGDRVALRTYWQNIIFVIAISVINLQVFSRLSLFGLEAVFQFIIWLIAWYILFLILVTAQFGRLRDANISGSWWFAHLIPYLGSAVISSIVFLIPGSSGENRFGPSPVRHRREELLGLREFIRNKRLWITFLVGFPLVIFINGYVDKFANEALIKETIEPRALSDYPGLQLNAALRAAAVSETNSDNYDASYIGTDGDKDWIAVTNVASGCEAQRVRAMIEWTGVYDPEQFFVSSVVIDEVLTGDTFESFESKSSWLTSKDRTQKVKAAPVSSRSVSAVRNGGFIQIFFDGSLLREIEEKEEIIFSVESLPKVLSLMGDKKTKGGWVEIDFDSKDFTIDRSYEVTPILLEKSLALWEFIDDAGPVELLTKSGVSVYTKVPAEQGSATSLWIDSFIERDSTEICRSQVGR